jgi:hypothetical protein
MSLAMSAAPYNDNENNNSNSAINNKRTTSHNRTQKRFPDQLIDTDKINNVLQSIHNNSSEGADDSNSLGDFNPPSPPISSGVQRTTDAKPSPVQPTLNNTESMQTLGRTPAPAEEYNTEKLDLNNFSTNYGSKITNEDYYKKFVPNYPKQQLENERINKQYYNQYPAPAYGGGTPDNNVLIEKINYMIHLLEENQDERTGSVTEEVILYSFLGIFIIFMADSFSRIGKYKR